MFYLSTIKGIELYGILALEKLIYFFGGTGSKWGFACNICRGGERGRVHVLCAFDFQCG